MSPATARRLPIGAELIPAGAVHFRVWAPARHEVEVVFEGRSAAQPLRLTREPDGYFSGLASRAQAGDLYRFRLDSSDKLVPDPASRFQPDGPHGPSQVVDPGAFEWTDAAWPGITPEEVVLYEMHVGTFTPEGTWAAAEERLPALVELGITCLEIMPVADFPGQFGWGYDGVDLFAPTRLYGSPDDFRRFIDRAHSLGMGAILDVVYNHLGPDGNYLKEFSPDYFSTKHGTEWGEALNFDAANSGPVREFFLANARYWIEEFHLDGFRFDATQSIFDDGPRHILADITARAREAAGRRCIYLVAENEPQETRVVRPIEQGGFGMDALWNDDFHHSAVAMLTGHNQAYYSDYLAKPQELISAAKWGYLFQGQHSAWQKKRRGTPALDLPPTAFVNFIENHDQLANLVYGHRTHRATCPGQHRAMTALMLLMPQTPMLFQGQEFAASAIWTYFADHNPDLAKRVRTGRTEFLTQFPSVKAPEMAARVPNPGDRRTFEQCTLDWSERERHRPTWDLHRDLLELRSEDPVFRAPRPRGVDGAVLGPEAFVLRYFGEGGDDRLVIVNFDRDVKLEPAPEPLLAPLAGKEWALLWSSESPRYGGCGIGPLETTLGWRIPGRATVVLRPAHPEKP
ncbi:MAG TPA: malto-oligosyltrehalose trehalohydrolase [Tepidisphaeraceae bacterium]